MKFTTETYTLPAGWACYIFNADSSGMEEKEIKECDDFFEREGNPHVTDASEEAWFSWSNDATSLGGDVLEYIALIEVEEKEGPDQ